MKGEIWKDIEGYEGLYQVSNMGRVKSLERMKWCGLNGGCYRIVPEKIMKGVGDGNGYLQVGLYREGKRKKCRINRLVAQAFLENPDNLPEVNHKDENKKNNCVDNLEWCSHSYNMTYNSRAKKVGKKNSKPVYSIDKESGLITYWESIREASRQLGISKGNICSCLKGKMKSIGGFYWIYADDDDNE